VEIAPLPGVASKITSSMSGHKPSTDTPTYAALQGAINHATDWSKAHPDHITAVILATDGQPTECDKQDIPSIAQVASAAANGTPKILTFVIGVGSDLANLNALAVGGGTNQAYIVDTTGNAQQQFLDALNKIRGTAAGCTYQIPVPTNGGNPNYDEVNVAITPQGGKTIYAYRVKDQASCPATGENWYYDNPAKPTQIILCASTCNEVMNAKNDEVDILLGCGSIVK
jgi:hypothetical protein